MPAVLETGLIGPNDNCGETALVSMPIPASIVFFDLLSEVIEPFKHHPGGVAFQLPWDSPPVDPPKPEDPEWRKKIAACIRKLADMSRKLAAE